jgi:hypothetical protein
VAQRKAPLSKFLRKKLKQIITTTHRRVIFAEGLCLADVWIQEEKVLQVGNTICKASDCKVLTGERLEHENFRMF